MNHIQTEHWLFGRGIVSPVRAELRPSDEGWTAANPDTGIFGVGSTPPEAIDDLRQAFVDHLHVLDRESSLTPGLREQRDFLRRHVAA